MNITRLAAAVQTLSDEINRTEIIPLVDQATELAATRSNMANDTYQQSAMYIRERAAAIEARDVLARMSPDLKETLLRSKYSRFFPASVARELMIGVSSNPHSSISSSELKIYQSGLKRLSSNLERFLSTIRDFDFNEPLISETHVSIDFLLPRPAFNNKAALYLRIDSAFVDIISSIEELVSGERSEPELIYTSTTDPVTGVGIFIVAVTPLMLFYEKILDVAQKQIDLLKAVKSLRAVLPAAVVPEESTVDVAVKELTRNAAEEAVRDIASVAEIQVDDGRKAELTNAIAMRSTTLVSAVSNGARISISLDSQVTLEGKFVDNALDYAKLKEIIDSTLPLEKAVSESFKRLDQSVPLIESLSSQSNT